MRSFNFGAGPAMMPEAVMLQAQQEFLDWHGSTMSICEFSHRSKEFMAIMEEVELNLREILIIPPHYKMIVVTSPTRLHFAGIPMNLLGRNGKAGYAETGVWSEMAFKEACRYGDIQSVTQAKLLNYSAIAKESEWQIDPDFAYIHYTDNETIHGLQFSEVPKVGQIPLVVDMTSILLSKKINISDYGLIYAGTQKNISPAGLTLIIIREDLLHQEMPVTPTSLNYRFLAEQKSLYYTPNTFSCYFMLLTLKWLKNLGGLEAIEKINREKSQLLYDVIDQSHGFYTNSVNPKFRSIINVVF